jgi:hypothetical protein
MIDSIQEGPVLACLKYYCAEAQRILQELYDRVPILGATVSYDRFKIDPATLIEFRVRTMVPGERERVLKYGSIGGASVVGAVLGGGKGIAVLLAVTGGPISAAILGATLAGSAAIAVYRMFRDANRVAIEEELENIRAQFQQQDTSANGKVRKRWNETVYGISTEVEKFLVQTIDELEGLTVVSKESKQRLSEEFGKANDALAAVEKLNREILSINKQALRYNRSAASTNQG